MNKNSNNHSNNKKIIKGNETIFPQRTRVSPMFLDNIITSNKTDADGGIINISPENAILAKKEVDDNHK